MGPAYTLDPSSALNSESFGVECAMTELLILMAFHHGVSRLEYRTVDGEFRIFAIVDERTIEWIPPPESMRDPTFKHLQTIFDVFPGVAKHKQLRVEASLATARCGISKDNLSAFITVEMPFSPTVNLRSVMQRYFRTDASKKGLFALLRYDVESTFWKLVHFSNKAMHRSRG